MSTLEQQPGRFGRVRRPLRPGDAHPGARRARRAPGPRPRVDPAYRAERRRGPARLGRAPHPAHLRRPPDRGLRRRRGVAQARGPAPHRRAQGQQHRGPGAARAPDGEAADHRRDRRGPARRGHRRLVRAARAALRGLHGRRGRPATGAQRPADEALRRHGAPGGERQPHPQGRDERGDPRLGDQRARPPSTSSAASPVRTRTRAWCATCSGSSATRRARSGRSASAGSRTRSSPASAAAPTRWAPSPPSSVTRAVRLVAVEAGGEGLATGKHGASLTAGRFGVLHGSASSVLQTDDGQMAEAHSVSAGLDYPGVGPGAGPPAGHRPARRPDRDRRRGPGAPSGVLPPRGHPPGAGDGTRAWPARADVARELGRGKRLLVNLSGRGDKDLLHVLAELERRAPGTRT